MSALPRIAEPNNASVRTEPRVRCLHPDILLFIDPSDHTAALRTKARDDHATVTRPGYLVITLTKKYGQY
jgi:hypothetical protein